MPGGDPGRGDDVAVAHVPDPLEHRRVGPSASRSRSSDAQWVVVRRSWRMPAACEHERAGAHARDPGAAGGDGPDPVDQRRVVDLAAGALAARHHEDVEGGRVRERAVGQDPHPLGAADGVGRLGDQDDPVAVHGPHREHLVRADEVELLRPVEDQDPGRGHTASRAGSCRGAEALAVLGRADAQGPEERPAHRLGGAEAAAVGDLLDARRPTPRAGGGPARPGPARRSGPGSPRSRPGTRGRSGGGSSRRARRGAGPRGPRRGGRRSSPGPRRARRARRSGSRGGC